MGESEEIVDPCRVSFHVVGYWPQDKTAFIKSLNPQKIWDGLDDFETQATLRHICIQAVNPNFPDEPAETVGVLRAQREGSKIEVYRTMLPLLSGEENTSAEAAAILEVAAARVVIGHGYITERDGLEHFLDGVAFFEANLGPIRGKE